MDAAIAESPATHSPVGPPHAPAGASETAMAQGPLARALRDGSAPLQAVMDEAQRLQTAGLARAAAQVYELWLATTNQPLRHLACFNWGTLLSAQGQDEAAEAAYRRALEVDAAFAPALLNLGHLMERRGDTEGALASWQRVMAADPPSQLEHRLHALNNSARLLELLRRYPQAESRMAQSLALKAAQPDVIQHYVHIRQKQCAWPHDQPVGEVSPHQFLAGTSLLAMMGLSDDPALQLLSAQRFVHDKVLKSTPVPAVPLFLRAPAPTGRIRLAYLSGDLHMHAVGLLTPELFELHDRSRFEVSAYCWTPESATPQRQRIVKAFDKLHRIGALDDATAARQIALAGIDVLVDLQGLTSGARPAILVQRPAPVQVSYLGLPGTSALPGVDWMLVDDYTMPAALEPFCTERPLRLPGCYQVSDRQREVAPTPERGAGRARYGLPQDAFVFCSFNNNHKFTAEVFASWMRIVAAVPGSVLWLLADNDTARANMLACAAAHGVAAERLVFAPRVAPPEYLARFTLADLMLDTFPFNAGTTASDALWMGLPIVTRSGRTVISRMAGSLLTAVGLPDLITEHAADYERLAIALGRQPARVASHRRYLAEHGRRSRLFDVPRTVREIEDAFERLALRARAQRAAGQLA